MKEKFKEVLKPFIMYTTRPIRREEKNGESYYFIADEQLMEYQQQGKVIEVRTYQTVHGPWSYATLDDGQINLLENYLLVGTLESYVSTCRYFGDDSVVPLYIHVEDGERLQRALIRERKQKEPRYTELCRRFLADEEDFSTSKLAALSINKIYKNDDFNICLSQISEDILRIIVSTDT